MSRLRHLASSAVLLVASVLAGQSPVLAQVDDYEQEPIKYSRSQPDNVITRLQARVDKGEAKLEFNEKTGYLRSVLAALDVPISSQTLVYSKTSLQRHKISPRTPRALFFNDDIYIGICQAGDVLEISAVDPVLGTVFYTLDQEESVQPKFQRQTDNCLICHGSSMTMNVPGHMVRSVYTDLAGFPILGSGSVRVDQTTPLEKRWGGWYVTGEHGNTSHLGNLVVNGKRVPEDLDISPNQNKTDLTGKFDSSWYLSNHSDIVALMVLEHQTDMHNLIARANMLTRQALHYQDSLNRDLGEAADHEWPSTGSRIDSATEPLVKYLLFSGEVPLASPIKGTSGFAEEFAQRGSRDAKGRSLRELDLERRMFKYPLSYLIESPAFDAIPERGRLTIYRRIAAILSGADRSPAFAHLNDETRAVLAEMLAERKPEFAAIWTARAAK